MSPTGHPARTLRPAPRHSRPLVTSLALALLHCGGVTSGAPDASTDAWHPASDARATDTLTPDAPAIVADSSPDDATAFDDSPDALVADDATAPDARVDDATDGGPVDPCPGGSCLPDCGPATAPTCSVTHAFDLADHMPAHLAVMFSMSWFGLPSSDPNGAGPDPDWGNWRWGGGCVSVNDPRTCAPVAGTPQRQVASRRRPLAGIYSSTGRDDESRRRVDLMLSTLRRPCDSGARLDAWSVQVDSLRFSSYHIAPGAPGIATASDYAYRALVTFLARADAGGMTSVVAPGIDSSWYWHFGDTRGLTTQAARLAALEDDLVDMVRIAAPHRSALRVGGKLLFYAWTGGTGSTPYISASDWQGVLTRARNRVGVDFYLVGGTTNPAFFTVFDAIAPWIETGAWQQPAGTTVYDAARTWTAHRHDGLIAALPRYPGREVWGGLTPGFDDYTRDWGACTERVVPRDPALIDAQFDYFTAQRAAGHAIRGMLLATWDDWTEGSEFEPDVAEGTAKLMQVRRRLGGYFGDPAEPAGDTRLDARWHGYGQARNCSGGAAVTAPAIDLRCP